MGASLDLDLGHLKRAESNVSEELGACGASEPNSALVVLGHLLASEVHVGILEDLVQAVLEHALERISDKSRAEALPDTLCAFLRNDGPQGTDTTLVLSRVDLTMRSEGGFPRKVMVLTCMLHLATSSGVIPAWVRPHARTPPSMHFA